MPSEDLARDATRVVHAALTEYADAWETTRGSIVTRFVCVAAVVTAEGESVIEVRGNGPDGGLQQWERLGLLEWARRDLRIGEDG